MSSALMLGQVGQQQNSPGAQPPIRAGKTGEELSSQLQAPYYQVNYDGALFMMDSDSITLASAHSTKGAMGTIKFVNGFFNPANSGKNAIIIAAHVATVSGTPAGPLFYNFFNQSPLTSASTGTIRSGLLGGAGASLMTPQTNVVLVASDADTSAVKQLCIMGGPAAVAAGAGLYDAYDFVDGKIIVPPGTAFGIAATGAGTSHVVQSSLFWIEQLI